MKQIFSNKLMIGFMIFIFALSYAGARPDVTNSDNSENEVIVYSK